MNFEPQKFFIGLIDFFSTILPGALLTYFFQHDAWPLIFKERACSIPGEPEGYLVFLFSSYLLGHFVFLLGSLIDEIYDRARKATLERQIKEMAWNGWLMPGWGRFLIRLVFKTEQNTAVNAATRIKKHYLDKMGAADAVNTFQWSKAYLAKKHPALLSPVERFEADSKFFRGLSVVLLALLIRYYVICNFFMVFVCLLLVIAALWRYMEQRLKSTNQAYWSVVTAEGADGLSLPKEKRAKGSLTHAGGLVFRDDSEGRKYLLVQAEKNPKEWVLPKGHIEAKEDPRETAVREVHEETGVWGEIIEPIKIQRREENGNEVMVQVYVMRARDEESPENSWRKHLWLNLELAKTYATHKETRKLLDEIDTRWNIHRRESRGR